MEGVEQSVGAGEFLWFLVLLCAPAILVMFVVQYLLMKRKGLLLRRRWLSIASLMLGAPLVVAIAALLWSLSPKLAVNVLSPSRIARYVFLPAIIAATIVMTINIVGLQWLARKDHPKNER